MQKCSNWIPCLLVLALCVLYGYTAAPRVTFHDSGELITAAHTLGIPHPPGSPTWCLIAHMFTRLPVGSPALRVHLMSGLFGALTCLFVFLLVRDMASSWRTNESWAWRNSAGVLSALMLGVSPTFWGKCVQAELYTLNAFFFSVLLYLFNRWINAQRDKMGSARWILVLAAFLFGIGSGNYLALLYFIPVFAVLVLYCNRCVLADYKLLLAALFTFALGFSVYAYLPIRSAADPAIDWGNPETLANFLSVMRREQWGAISPSLISSNFISLYFEWFRLHSEFGFVGLLLALFGLLFGARHRKPVTLTLAACFFVYAFAMAFMFAATPTHALDPIVVATYDLQEINIPLYLVISVFPGLGLYAAFRVLCRKNKVLLDRWSIKAMSILLAIAVPGLMAIRSFSAVNHRHARQAYDYGNGLLDEVPQGGWLLIFPGTDNNLCIPAYLKFCENRRSDVYLVTPSRAFVDYLAALAATNQAGISDQTVLSLLQSDPDRFIQPIFNQPESSSTNPASIVFASFPKVPALVRHLRPVGLTFRLNASHPSPQTDTIQFWRDITDTETFAQGPSTKPDVREHMLFLLVNHGLWHHFSGDFRTAAFLYQRALTYSSRVRPDLMVATADCMMESGKLDLALKYGKMALDASPNDKNVLNTLGIILARQGQFMEAAGCFSLILQQDPENKAAIANLARVKTNITSQVQDATVHQ